MANFQIGNSTKKSNKTQSFINRQPKDRSGSSDLELAVYSEPDSIIVGGNPGLYSDYDISGASGNDEIIVGGNVDHNAGSYDASGGTDVVIHGTGGNDEITGYGASEEKRVDGLGAGRAPLFNKGSKRGVSLGKKGALRPDKLGEEAVEWFTKEDVLAATHSLQSQLSASDPAQLSFADLNAPLFATGSESLPSLF